MKKKLLATIALPLLISNAFAQGITSNLVSNPFSFCEAPRPKCKGCPLEGEWDRICHENIKDKPQFKLTPTPAQQEALNKQAQQQPQK